MKIHLLHKFFASLHQNGWLFFIVLALISYMLSVKGFISISQTQEFDSKMLMQAVILSFGDVPDDRDIWIFSAKIFWMLTLASAAFSLFLRDWSQKQFFKAVKEENHTAVIGLGKLSYSYVNNLDTNKTIIYNNNSQTISSESFSDNGFAIKELTLEEIGEELNILSMEKAVINLGDDRKNINMAFEIIEKYLSGNYQHPLRVIVRIENRELNALFMSNKIFTKKDSSFRSSKIEIKTYSFFEECAVKLFEDNFIDGEDDTIIKTHEEYAIAIVGDGKLANKIIYEAAKIAHLPSENILNIYLVGKESEQFKKELLRSYPYIENIPSIKLHTNKHDYKTLEFYKSSLWDTKNLTNIIICYDDEDTNLEIASSMQDKTFLQKEDIKTKVLFGVYNQGSIAQKLDSDDESFKIFQSFGDAKKILTIENLFDDKNHLIAKLINYTYELVKDENYKTPYNPNIKFEYHTNKDNKKKIDKDWFKATFTDKASSLAQAKHIKMKLKSLGLAYQKSQKTLDELLQLNRSLLDSKFDVEYKGDYPFPKSFDDTLFHKMIHCEHNRWNAYHYLNGWVYEKYNSNQKSEATEDEKNIHKSMKAIKKHNCLLPVSDFPQNFIDERLIQLIEWDIYATMYIPNYLADAGYEMIPLEANNS